MKNVQKEPSNVVARTEVELSAVDFLIKSASFVKKVNNVCKIKNSLSKIVSTRSSTIMSPPLQLVFPGCKSFCTKYFTKIQLKQIKKKRE